MKKLTWIAAFSLMCGMAMAQPDTSKVADEIEIEIEGRSIVIDTETMGKENFVNLNEIIREVSRRSAAIMAKRAEMLASIDRREESGDISEEQAEELREMVEERTEQSLEKIEAIMESWEANYEARMEAWEEAYEARMEEWEEEVEARAESGENFRMPPVPPLPPMPEVPDAPRAQKKKVIINDDGIVIRKSDDDDDDEPFALRFEDEEIEIEEEDNEPRYEATDGYFDINFGFDQQFANGEDLITEGPQELNFWKSTVFELGLGAKTRIGHPGSPLYIKYGGEVSWHNFRLTDDNVIFKADDGVLFTDSAAYTNIEKTKYHIAYLNVPVMLQLDFSQPGDRDEAFTLGAGGYAGVRINAKRELEYENSTYREIEEKAKSDFFTSQFRYGVMGQIGFDSFKITAKYDLNSFFKDTRGPDYNMASITLGWTL